ncbi:MAG: 50S ribosomal protein L1 [Candidatus Eremiobacterota bacterium]
MPNKTKKFVDARKQYDVQAMYPPEEALAIVKKIAFARFNETVEVHVRLGIDPRKSDQTVRGTTVLPHGTGKTPRVIVFTKGDKIKAAEDAGADAAGAEELVARVKGGWAEFDICVATPDMMGLLGKELGRVLGPRMPNPKAGTVAPDPAKAVAELKSGKIQYRTDKLGIVHCPLGKTSFEVEQLVENLRVLMDALVRARPATAKGAYLRSVYVTSTMGPSVKIDPSRTAVTAAAAK